MNLREKGQTKDYMKDSIIYMQTFDICSIDHLCTYKAKVFTYFKPNKTMWQDSSTFYFELPTICKTAEISI